MLGGSGRRVHRRRDRRALLEDVAAPFEERYFFRSADESQARLAAARCGALLVADDRRELLRRVGRAVAEQAVQQEHVEEAHRACGDADRLERIQVHQPDLDVLDATTAQGMQRTLARTDHALGPDCAVELVLDLQHAGRELPVVLAVADPDGLVRRIGFRQRLLQRCCVAVQAVIAHRKRGLRVALISQPSHPQRCRVRKIERVVAQSPQHVRAAGGKARAYCRRRAEEIKQQPRMAAEIADEREVFVVGARVGEREVVVDAGDRLHAPAVAVREARAIDGLGTADVGGPVAADGNRSLRRKLAGHARAPQQLIADRPIDDLVNFRDFRDARIGAGVYAGNELELRLAEVGRDVRVLERRAERCRMRSRRERSVGPHAQALLFDSAPKLVEHVARHRLQALLARPRGFGGRPRRSGG